MQSDPYPLFLRDSSKGEIYTQALAWYRRAAGHGDSDAENQLGYMAEQGWGQPQGYAEAFSWYYKASEHGNDHARL